MMQSSVRQAVVLAAGAGKRMRRRQAAVEGLSPQQLEMAAQGLKGLVPVLSRPFLDYVLEALCEAGVERVCLVISPQSGPLESRYRTEGTAGMDISFALQTEPRGTADALLAAAGFVGDQPFVLINSDNYYSSRDLARLACAREAAVLALECRAVLKQGGSNVDRVRMENYALLELGPSGYLERIVEKPGSALWDESVEHQLVGVNAWRFEPTILEACRAVSPSVRGELELPSAVQHAIERGDERVRVIRMRDPLLDLSTQADIGRVERLLPVLLARGGSGT